MDFETPLLLTLVSENSPLAVATLNWLVHGDAPVASGVDWVVFDEPLEL
ncbi:hypothetical protein [Mycobacteroides abscessus]|nr:hypothetical protein [Mycobacteroides abscessus]SLH35793.1 Uncharacterised protein [Mycobacteroides abscessus subsp. massiliense]